MNKHLVSLIFFPFPKIYLCIYIYDMVLFVVLLVFSSKGKARFLFRNILLCSNSKGEGHKFY